MISWLENMALLMLLILIYTYVGYPVVLLLLRFILPERPVNNNESFPDVTLIISCFNEEYVIREKLENSLALDYPEAKLEVIVVSDASTDKTDEIVRGFESRGVRLIRQEKNIGKTSGLNLAVPQAKGEIVVFSDANAIYRQDAIKMLVRNFDDKEVGYVVGQARYSDSKFTSASRSEATYWELETFLKKMEGRVHSVVGGDGAIYAIRRELYEKMEATDINDFVNPLQIVLNGYRGVYEPQAVCYEESAGKFSKEFKRKVRIVNRSFSGLMRVSQVMNPFKTGLFSFEVISHKLLRWLAPVPIMIFFIASFLLAILGESLFQWITLFNLSFLLLAYIGFLLSETYNVWPVISSPYYFILVNIASIIGVGRSLRGEVQATWDTVRTSDVKVLKDRRLALLIHTSFIILLFFFIHIAGILGGYSLLACKVVFWSSLILIIYGYIGYPLALRMFLKYKSMPVNKKEIFPSVSLLVCAYNEEDVIDEKVMNSLEIDYPREKFRIIIASDGSTDKTNDIVRKYTDERLVLMDYPEREGKISVINRTVPELDSDIIVFSDANTMYEQDSIKKLVSSFNDPTVGGVSADVVLNNEGTTFGKSESLYYLYERWIQKMESETGSIIGADGGMYAIKRELFVSPSDNIILDDFVISMNVVLNGYRLVYEEDAVGHEENIISSATEFLRKSRVIAGAVQVLLQNEGVPSIKHGKVFYYFVSHKFIRWLIPVFLVVMLLANLMIVLAGGERLYAVTLLIQNLLYLLAAADMFIPGKYRYKLTSVPYYFVMENTAALYGIYKGLSGKQAVKWEKFRRKP